MGVLEGGGGGGGGEGGGGRGRGWGSREGGGRLIVLSVEVKLGSLDQNHL